MLSDKSGESKKYCHDSEDSLKVRARDLTSKGLSGGRKKPNVDLFNIDLFPRTVEDDHLWEE